MKRAKKRILRRIVWIGMILMAAGFLSGCMETSEDDCIVKEKRDRDRRQYPFLFFRHRGSGECQRSRTGTGSESLYAECGRR